MVNFMGRPHFYIWECGLLNLNFLKNFDIIKYKIRKERFIMIVSAAVQIHLYTDGRDIIIPVHRHIDAMQILSLMGYTESMYRRDMDGFLTEDGRFLDRWADSSILDELKDCFAHYDNDDCRRALLSTHKLFARLSRTVADNRGLPYPEKAEACAMSYMTGTINKEM
jgi:hypothetical protein